MKASIFLKWVLVTTLFLMFFGCATTNPVMEFKQSQTAPTLTKSAYKKVEPILQKLQPGQSIEDTGLEWPILVIGNGSKPVGLYSANDGWAGALSGDLHGAVFKIGDPFAIDGDSLFGQHIYGYIVPPAIFIPKYSVQTVSSIVSEQEYQALKEQDKGQWTFAPGSNGDKIYFKNVKIHQVKEIQDYEKNAGTLNQGDSASLNDAQNFFSKNRFEQSAPKLSEIDKGTDIFTTIRELNGVIVANNGGVGFTVFIDGFLKYKGSYIFSKTTSNGIYAVWPFGYVENGQEVPTLALIYKNGAVYDLVSFTSEKEISRSLE